MATKKVNDPFVKAITEFISDVKRKEDTQSPFYKEVLSKINTHSHQNGDQSKLSAENLHAFVEELERKQKRTSNTRWVSEKLHPLLSGLDQYIQICDVMSQAGGSIGILVYGGARVVLQLALNFHNCFDQILLIMEEVGNSLDCYNCFAGAYEKSVEMQALLIRTYKNIVSFWQDAAKLLSKPAYKTLLKGIVKPLAKEWSERKEKLKADSDRVLKLAVATSATMQKNKDEEQKERRSQKMKRQVVDWIKGGIDGEQLDTRKILRQNEEICHENTCEWLFEHPLMKDWLGHNETTGAWYSAPPGAGKTVLAATVVRKLQDRDLKTVAFFYSFNDTIRKKPITALRCLALQLLTHARQVPDKVQRLYEEDVESHFFELHDQRTAVEVVRALLMQQPRVHIIVDGLDECEDRELLTRCIRPLLEVKRPGIVKWFFTSRPDSAIRSIMKKHQITEINAPQISLQQDIKLYVTEYLRNTLDHSCSECVEFWTEESEGNFLWAVLMLRILGGADLTCDAEIDEALEKFPKGLAGCYMRTLDQLSKRSEPQQQLARRIFSMVVAADQPLRLSELSHALGTIGFATDFSTKNLRKVELIEDLCSNLIVFDRSSNGTETDPALKVAHKSIQDFFLEDPTELKAPENLQKYFVSRSVANRELGEACLTYLSYERYNKPQDIMSIVTQEDHAFLRHAALFWHAYLSHGDHSQELFERVKKFIESPAFWTCVAVQCRFGPYLLAQYDNVGGAQYRLRGTGPKGGDNSRIHYGIPLPEWLEDYKPFGPGITQAFVGFIHEWHALLISQPSALNQCAMSFRCMAHLPGRRSWLSDRVKLYCLCGREPWPFSISSLSVVDVTHDAKDLIVDIIGNEIIAGTSQIRCIRLKIHPDGSLHVGLQSEKMLLPNECTPETILLSHEWSRPQNHLSALNPTLLEIKEYEVKQRDKDVSIEMVSGLRPPQAIGNKWHLVGKTIHTLHNQQRAATFQLSSLDERSSRDDPNIQSDSTYGSAAPSLRDNDSDADSDSEAPSDHPPVNDCMLILYENEPPLFQFSKPSNNQIESICAVHPVEKIAVWSPAPHQLFVQNLEPVKLFSQILIEPATVQFSNLSAMRKEFRFSESGDVLYYLLYTAEQQETSIKQAVTVLCFQFTRSGSEEELVDLQPLYSAQSISYECYGEIQHPLILTTWTSENLYIALPPLSCNAKVLRLPLCGQNENEDLPKLKQFQTLCNPAYFPYSTPYRNPQLKIIESRDDGNNSKQILLLALDAQFQDSSSSSSDDGSNDQFPLNSPSRVLSEQPALLTIELDPEADWRDYCADDERSQELRDRKWSYDALRGSFLDSNKRFKVPIRSGMDWTRKAFLSCA
ncbi:hypothetical protein BGW36DRAFT_354957 [Talaromyces proteolyticus]|uniref:NACHT domain-containing protein n=1 Tax=Talaromyces proteolyticus TaxID=1131652 RepID=A0AAD4KXU1_9EURO|nr:uncharacterized protein BGW36DRAFT_354957 [Talaromyces proteolyticus]KAH8703540.1 hypothetical protein BGW36DRAFT_354957 [Talaromyces proteolyticus]